MAALSTDDTVVVAYDPQQIFPMLPTMINQVDIQIGYPVKNVAFNLL